MAHRPHVAQLGRRTRPARARSTNAAVARKLVIRSRRPWAAEQVPAGQRRRPRSSAGTTAPGRPRRPPPASSADVDGGAGAHRVAEQDDGHVAELAAYLLERPARVLDRAGAAVPAAVAVAQQPGADAGLVQRGG